MSPPVSLVIASHRRGDRIGPTLDSVAAQTVAPAEILVFNDGGYEPTRTFIAGRYPAVRVVDGTGGNAGAARNLGAKHAAQPYVVFLDDDDRLHPHAIETLWRVVQTFPEARAAFADHTFTDEDRGIHHPNHHELIPAFHRLRRARALAISGDVRLYGRALYCPMLWGGLLQQPWLIHYKTFLALGGFDTAFASNEDWDLFLRLVRAHPIALTDCVISDHLVETGRAHVSRSATLDETGRAIVQKHLGMATSSLDLRSMVVLRRRLGRMYKTDGDRVAPVDLRVAWRAYVRALAAWPFDHVVVIRTVWWPLKMASRVLAC